MGISIATPTDDQWPELFEVDARGFGFVPEPGDIDMRRPIIDMSRFRIAVDRGQIVGVAGSYAFDVTLPGGTTIPMSGITWVSVSATHRRRGVLTQLLDACHADTDDRGEPVAMLFASEGGIYERFGYGIATHIRSATIERATARVRTNLSPDRDSVGYLDGDDATDHRAKVWEQARRRRAGDVSRSAVWGQFLADIWAKATGGMSPAFCLAHADGYAMYRIAEKWEETGPGHRMEVVEVAALTQQAHLDLWNTLVGVDLVATVRARSLPMDDPLAYYFENPRSVRTTSLGDGLWVNVRDVAVCFGARSYGTTDKLIIELDGKRFAIESDGAESSCRSVRTRPDLVVDQPSLGALLLGGVRPSQLLAAGRITARSADIAARADAFFLTTPAPHCQTFF